MDKNANLYDIDGELLRKSGDNTKMTVEEAEKKAKYYQEKLDKLEEGDPKADIYRTYIRNLNIYKLNMMINNPAEFLNNVKPDNKTTEEEAKEALMKLIDEANNDGDTEKGDNDEIPTGYTDNNEDTTNEEPGDAAPIERGDSDIQEERPLSQSDLLVERSDVNTIMDEYVEFEQSNTTP